MKKVSCTDRVINEVVRRVNEERNTAHIIKRKVLVVWSLFRNVIEENMEI